uniref:Glycosyl transferase CAP10 domain-containing protein n=1 Tax=Glossina palpalis gambiensis TaxID=67801 RepID=A0A1B0B706_9MUSC
MQTFQLFLMFLLILSKNLRTLQNISDSDDGVFIAKDECQMGKSSNYKEGKTSEITFNIIIQKIEKARKSQSPCSTDPKDVESVCHQNVIDSDLGIFQKNGITHSTLDEAAKSGRRCKIYNHRLYRESNCMFASRCEGVQHFILKLLPELPDMDFVINTRGWPQVPLTFNAELKASAAKSYTTYLMCRKIIQNGRERV